MIETIKRNIKLSLIALLLMVSTSFLGIHDLDATPLISQQLLSSLQTTQNITIPIETVLETDEGPLKGTYTMNLSLWKNYHLPSSRKKLWDTTQDVFFKNGYGSIVIGSLSELPVDAFVEKKLDFVITLDGIDGQIELPVSYVPLAIRSERSTVALSVKAENITGSFTKNQIRGDFPNISELGPLDQSLSVSSDLTIDKTMRVDSAAKKVGILTDNPKATLDINGNIKVDKIQLPFTVIHDLKETWVGTGNYIYYLDKVGLGTRPNAMLDVSGSVRITGDITVKNNLDIGKELHAEQLVVQNALIIGKTKVTPGKIEGNWKIDGSAENVNSINAAKIKVDGIVIDGTTIKGLKKLSLNDMSVGRLIFNSDGITSKTGKLKVQDIVFDQSQDLSIDRLDVEELTAEDSFGIGTVEPRATVEVKGPIKIATASVEQSGVIQFSGGRFQGFNGNTWMYLDNQGEDDGPWEVGNKKLFVTKKIQNIGIGTQKADEKLVVLGNVKVDGNINIENIKIEPGEISSTIDFSKGSLSNIKQLKSSQINVGDIKIENNMISGINGLELNKLTVGDVSLSNKGVGIGSQDPSVQIDVVGTVNATNLLVDGEPIKDKVTHWTKTQDALVYTQGSVGIGRATDRKFELYKPTGKLVVDSGVFLINSKVGMSKELGDIAAGTSFVFNGRQGALSVGEFDQLVNTNLQGRFSTVFAKNSYVMGESSTILGGKNNKIIGDSSVLLGGENNEIKSDNSLVIGQNIILSEEAQNSFVWAPENNESLQITKANSFILFPRNNGNVGIGTKEPSYKLDINGILNASKFLVNGKPIQDAIQIWEIVSTPNNLLIAPENSKVGIGTHVVNADLEVMGDVNVSESLKTKQLKFNVGSINEAGFKEEWGVSNGKLTVGDIQFSETTIESTSGPVEIDGIQFEDREISNINQLIINDTLDVQNNIIFNDSDNIINLESAVFAGSIKLGSNTIDHSLMGGISLEGMRFQNNTISSVNRMTANRVNVSNKLSADSINVIESIIQESGQASLDNLTVNGAAYLALNPSSKVVIGEMTSDKKLTIDGNFKTTGSLKVGEKIWLSPQHAVGSGSFNGNWNLNNNDINNTILVSASNIINQGSSLTNGQLTGIKSMSMSGDFTVNTNQFHVDKVTRYIGVGTRFPEYGLDVIGTVNATGYLKNGKNLDSFESQWIYTSSEKNSVQLRYPGNVGIGTEWANEALVVNGGMNVSGDLKILDQVVWPNTSIKNNTFSSFIWDFGKHTLSDINLLEIDLIETEEINVGGMRFMREGGSGVIRSVNPIEIESVVFGDESISTINSIMIGQLKVKDNSIENIDKESGVVNINDIEFSKNDIKNINNLSIPSSSIVFGDSQTSIGNMDSTANVAVSGIVQAKEFLVNGDSIILNLARWDNATENVFYSLGNVGIDSEIPQQELDINGSLKFSNDIILEGNLDNKRLMTVSSGGTSSSTPVSARISLGLELGKSILEHNVYLQSISDIELTKNMSIFGVSSQNVQPTVNSNEVQNETKWSGLTPKQVRDVLGLGEDDDVKFNSIIVSKNLIVSKLGVGKVPTYDLDINGTLKTDVLIVGSQNVEEWRTDWRKENDDIWIEKQVFIGMTPSTSNINTENLVIQGDIYLGNDMNLGPSVKIDGVDISELYDEIVTILNKVRGGIDSHVINKSNPHNVSKSQLGLSEVENINVKNTFSMNPNQSLKLDELRINDQEFGFGNTDTVKGFVVYNNKSVGIGGGSEGATLRVHGKTYIEDSVDVIGSVTVNSESRFKELKSTYAQSPQLNTDEIFSNSGDEISLALSSSNRGLKIKNGGYMAIQRDIDPSINLVVGGKTVVSEDLIIEDDMIAENNISVSVVKQRDSTPLNIVGENGVNGISIQSNKKIGIGTDELGSFDITVSKNTVFLEEVDFEKNLDITKEMFASEIKANELESYVFQFNAINVKDILPYQSNTIVVAPNYQNKALRIMEGGYTGIGMDPDVNYALKVSGNILFLSKAVAKEGINLTGGILTNEIESADSLSVQPKENIYGIYINEAGQLGLKTDVINPNFDWKLNGAVLVSKNMNINATLNVNQKVVGSYFIATHNKGLSISDVTGKGIIINTGNIDVGGDVKAEGELSLNVIKSIGADGLGFKLYDDTQIIQISESGKFGVNTIYPSENLHVIGDVRVSGNAMIGKKFNNMFVDRLYEVYLQPQLGEEFDVDGILIKQNNEFVVTANRLKEWDTAYSWDNHNEFPYLRAISSLNMVPLSVSNNKSVSSIMKEENGLLGINTSDLDELVNVKSFDTSVEKTALRFTDKIHSWDLENNEVTFNIKYNDDPKLLIDETSLVVNNIENFEVLKGSVGVKELISIGTKDIKQDLLVKDQHPAQILLKGNTTNQTNKNGSPIYSDMLMTLVTNNDKHARGLHLQSRRLDRVEWFMGVPFEGDGFQIGRSDTTDDIQDQNGPWMRSNAIMFFDEANGNVGINTIVPSADLHIVGDQQDIIKVGTPTFNTIFVLKESNRIGVQTGQPKALLHIKDVQGGSEKGRVKFSNKQSQTAHEFVFDNTVENAYYVIKNSTGNETVKLNSGGDSFFTGGNLGINKEGATYQLEIIQSQDKDQIIRMTNTTENRRKLIRFGDSALYTDLGLSTKEEGNKFYVNTTSGTKLVVQQNGNVGIGELNPTNNLSINGSVGVGQNFASQYSTSENYLVIENRLGVGEYMPESEVQITDVKPTIKFEDEDNQDPTNWVLGSRFNSETNETQLGLGVENQLAGITLRKTGEIGINTDTPENELSVSGSMSVGGGYASQTTSSGNLIIEKRLGVDIANPNFALDVQGVAKTTLLRLEDSKSTHYTQNDRPMLYNYDNGNIVIQSTSAQGSDIILATQKDDTETLGRVVINNKGFVGIGTNIPREVLHVVNEDNSTLKVETRADKKAIVRLKGQEGEGEILLNEDENLEIKGENMPLGFQANFGNVGVDVTNPTSKLEVSGNIRILYDTGAYKVGNIKAVDSNGLRIEDYENSLGVMIRQGGNVGIGQSIPDAQLHVYNDGDKNILIESSNGVKGNDESDSYILFRESSRSLGNIYRTTSGDDKDGLAIKSSNESNSHTPLMSLQENGGTVSIGELQDQTKSLEVKGNFKAQDQIKLTKSQTAVSQAGAKVLFNKSDDSNWAGIGVDQDTLWLSAGGSANKAKAVHFTNEGYMGIGRQDPQGILNITGPGNTQLKLGGNSDTWLNINSPGSKTAKLNLKDGNTNDALWTISQYNNTTASDTKYLKFSKDGQANAISINDSGNVGIGIENATSSLHINGKMKIDSNLILGEESSTPVINLNGEAMNLGDGGIKIAANKTVTFEKELKVNSMKRDGVPVGVPAGTIVMYSGTAAELNSMAEWVLCDGTKHTFTKADGSTEYIQVPNLSDQFIRGADKVSHTWSYSTGVGAKTMQSGNGGQITGGSATHQHNNHNHGGDYDTNTTGGDITFSGSHNHTHSLSNITYTNKKTDGSVPGWREWEAEHWGHISHSEVNSEYAGTNREQQTNRNFENSNHSHEHKVNVNHKHNVNVDNARLESINNLPTYYNLAFIMKIK